MFFPRWKRSSLFAAAGAAGSTTLTSNITAFWKLDEASGSRADSVGSNTLTDNNTVTQAAGKVGNAAQFTAANLEYLSITDNAALSMGAGLRMSIAGWVYFDTVATKDIWGKFGGAGNREYLLVYNNTTGRFEWNVSTDGTAVVTANASTFGAVSVNTWYFVCTDYDGATAGVSVNAGTRDTAALATDIFDGAADFALGTRLPAAAQYWNGRMDAIGFWKRALTTAECAELYNSGNGQEYPFV